MTDQSYFHSTRSLDSITGFLNHCSQSKNLGAIKKLHARLLRTGLLFISLNFHTKLIVLYTTCHRKNNLQTLTNFFRFMNPRNPLHFNAILSEFSRNGLALNALKTFSFMQINGVPIDSYTLCSSLTASSSIRNVRVGKQVHALVAKSGWSSSVFVGSALVDLYAKSLVIDDAEVMFDEIPVKNTVCANALLSGYGEAKMWLEGLDLVRKMPVMNLDYDHFTMSAILRACAGLSAFEFGMQVHAYLIRTVYDVGKDVFLQSSLIEMYGKCGLVGKAWQVFNLAGIGKGGGCQRDVVLWTSMLGIYGRNGHSKEVIRLYQEMLKEGIKPDEVAFVTVLSACGHTGQVNLGVEFFESMTRDFALDPGPEHYGCLIDLLCRAGQLERAWKLVNEMLCKGDGSCSVSMWGALLSACKDCGNIELGKLAAQKALDLDPQNVGVYVMLSNLYAKFGMWDEIEQLRELMKERGLKKDVGCSWIEVT
ncbi:pentatricopeptide repeat-containing protein At2g13600-like [Corylus avellana]|uniref:pentatricopeptide repeat-containing protein At2g13600-like n=1 Tax=Corylus avellana TaxID=13451 RepID=UPI001E1F1ED7|nr:pentatricopeptide repeat-containing protein At2g13600-like [Corylus avellana]